MTDWTTIENVKYDLATSAQVAVIGVIIGGICSVMVIDRLQQDLATNTPYHFSGAIEIIGSGGLLVALVGIGGVIVNTVRYVYHTHRMIAQGK